jgi:hypothetical protein
MLSTFIFGTVLALSAQRQLFGRLRPRHVLVVVGFACLLPLVFDYYQSIRNNRYHDPTLEDPGGSLSGLSTRLKGILTPSDDDYRPTVETFRQRRSSILYLHELIGRMLEGPIDYAHGEVLSNAFLAVTPSLFLLEQKRHIDPDDIAARVFHMPYVDESSSVWANFITDWGWWGLAGPIVLWTLAVGLLVLLGRLAKGFGAGFVAVSLWYVCFVSETSVAGVLVVCRNAVFLVSLSVGVDLLTRVFSPRYPSGPRPPAFPDYRPRVPAAPPESSRPRT